MFVIYLVILGLVWTAVILLFAVLFTDGRYFGKRIMRQVYDRFGSAMFSNRQDTARWRRLAQHLRLTGNEVILDVGTAVGHLPLVFSQTPGFGGQVVGLDWSPHMLQTAVQSAKQQGVDGRTAFAVADARVPLPFPNQSFDIIICLELLETLPHADRILAELVRILQPDGRLVLSLYRGVTAVIAALNLDWYQQRLTQLGINHIEKLEGNQNSDWIIASSTLVEKDLT